MVMLVSSGSTQPGGLTVNISSDRTQTVPTYTVAITITNCSQSEVNDLLFKASALVGSALADTL